MQRSQRYRGIALLLLLSFFASAPARSQTSSTGTVDNADVLFQAARYEEALAAYRAMKAPQIGMHDPGDFAAWGKWHSLQIAQCLDHLHRWDEAVGVYLMIANFGGCDHVEYSNTGFPAACRLADMYRQAGAGDSLLTLLAEEEKTQLAFYRLESRRDTTRYIERARFDVIRRRLTNFPDVITGEIAAQLLGGPLDLYSTKAPKELTAFLKRMPVVPPGTRLPVSMIPTNIVFKIQVEGGYLGVPLQSASSSRRSSTTTTPRIGISR